MARLTRFIMATALLDAVAGQSQSQAQSALVTQIFFPLADAQPLDASIIAQSGDATTILMNCAPGTPSDECGFPSPITLTVGPSTLHHQPSGIYQILGDIDCKITASSVADCTVTAGIYTEAADESGTGDGYITTPAPTSSTTSDIVSGTDVSFLEITITAGLEAMSVTSTTSGSGSAATTATAKPGSESGTMSRTSTGSTISGTSGSTSSAAASGNAAAGFGRGVYAKMGAVAVLITGSTIII